MEANAGPNWRNRFKHARKSPAAAAAPAALFFLFLFCVFGLVPSGLFVCVCCVFFGHRGLWVLRYCVCFCVVLVAVFLGLLASGFCVLFCFAYVLLGIVASGFCVFVLYCF